MNWEVLKYNFEEVDNAGSVLSRDYTFAEFYRVIGVIDNWRAVHAFPLNTFQIYLRKKARSVDSKALVAQRIKRLSSIEWKLKRMPWLTLSKMQDIGGCRAVVKSVDSIEELVEIYKQSDIKHKLIDEDDYVLHPKRSGYRSHHLIYSYYSDKKTTYNGRKIEIQIRSKLQHAWATAVETVGTFTRQALKSSQGEKDWLRFFQLMGTIIALKENKPPVPNTPNDYKQLIDELRDCAESLQVESRLSAYGSALKTLEQEINRRNRFYILALNPGESIVTVNGYKVSEIEQALKDYSKIEQKLKNVPGGEAVLVSVDSVNALKSAYPNYFLDTVTFRNELKSALKKGIQRSPKTKYKQKSNDIKEGNQDSNYQLRLC